MSLMRTNFLTPSQAKGFTWAQYKGYGYGLGVRTLIDRAAAGSLSPAGEFGGGGAAGALVFFSPETGVSVSYAQHTLSPREEKVLPELRNVICSCIGG